MISLDSETTGIDLHHSARPFFVTVCRPDSEPDFWEWDVDPLTRQPVIPQEDINRIARLVAEEDRLVLQNAKFDVKALASVDPLFGEWWPWDRTHDTLIAGHLLASNRPHDLTSMVLQYLGINVQPYEDELERVVKECRTIAKREFPDWVLAGKDVFGMPSAKEKTWKYDTWLPMALVKEGKGAAGYCHIKTGQGWDSALREYACADSFFTLKLWEVMEQELHRRGLWEIYLERMKVIPVAFDMEQRGVSLSKRRLDEQRDSYREDANEAGCLCVGIAASYGHELELPKSGNNKSLSTFLFDVMGLPAVDLTETGKPALTQRCLETYESTLEPGSKQLAFVQALKAKRRRDTAVNYLDGYERYWLPMDEGVDRLLDQDWHVLHPSLNPTGTDTLRWSSSNPNEQNISKKEGFNLRRCFGPATGKEWWSLDYQNLELRIPAFEAGEADLVWVFEHPDDPPYHGSYHLVVFDLLFPELFAEHGKACKTLFESTNYQWVKNGNFAVIYGAQEMKADETYHRRGAYSKIRRRFPRIAELNDRWKTFADKHGYVETIPDRTVNPRQGYPILCSRSEDGRVMPTVPLNYHVQSTAMWCTMKAMIRCHRRLQEDEAGGRIVMQVHDELVLEYPRRGNPARFAVGSNLGRVREMAKLMAMSGDDVGVPTPVSVEWHPEDWSEGVPIKV